MNIVKDIRQAIIQKHAIKKHAVFFEVCIDRLRFDSFVIVPSYKKPNHIIYEIKSSRADFKSDKKWQKYLKYSNQFYFICPPNSITKADIPKGVGLIYYIKGKLKVIQGSSTIVQEIPKQLFISIAINKCSNRYESRIDVRRLEKMKRDYEFKIRKLESLVYDSEDLIPIKQHKREIRGLKFEIESVLEKNPKALKKLKNKGLL